MQKKYDFLSLQLKDLIREQIQTGTEKFPTEAALCRQFHVSRQTVRKALAQLAAQGMLTSRQGSGYYITGSLGDPSQNIIAILVPEAEEYRFPALLSDLRNELKEAGFGTTFYEHHNSHTREREILELLQTAPPRGLMIRGCQTALPNPNDLLYRRLFATGTMGMFLEKGYSNLTEIPAITTADHEGSFQIVQGLLSHGHENIAALFPWDMAEGPSRYALCQHFLQSENLFLSDDHVAWYDGRMLRRLRQQKDSSFLTDFIHHCLPGCSAVICQNDEIAYWLIATLFQNGYRVPGDISVICYEQSYLCELSSVPIASLFFGTDKFTQVAAQAMVRKLKGLPVVSQEVPWQLIMKESVGDIL